MDGRGDSIFQQQFWTRGLYEFVISILISLPVLWVLMPGGLPNTADGTVHFVRATEMLHAWQDGVLLPRWSENLGYGYGIPLFVYAPPLPYLLTVALSYLGMTLETAFKGMMVLGVLVAVFGAYRLGQTMATLWQSPKSTSSIRTDLTTMAGIWAGAVSAAAFLYAPIMLRELFIQGNIAQYWAWTFSPWAAWAVLRIYQTHRFSYVLALAFALLGTLLSHNAAALLLMATIGGLGPILFIATRNLRGLALTVAGSIVGLWLGFWFWGPALLEGQYVQLHHIVASDFRPRFIPLADLLALSPPLDSGAINPYFPLTLGAAQVWLGVTGILAFFSYFGYFAIARNGDHEETAHTNGIANDLPGSLKLPGRFIMIGAGVFFTLLTLFCAFMATAWSEPVWAILPFVDLFEWPFRWHGFTALGLSWLCAFAVYALMQTLQTRPTYAHAGAALVGSVTLLLLIGTALVNLYPQKLLTGTRIASPYEVARYEVKSSAVGTTSLGEFNPIWVDGLIQPSPLVDDYLSRRPIDRLPDTVAHPSDSFLGSGATGLQTESSVHRQEFLLNLPEPIRLTLNLLYFPGWWASIDGQPIPIRPHEESGLIDTDLPAGEYTLTLTFGPTPLRRVAGLLSLLGWIAVFLYLIFVAYHRLKHARSPRPYLSGSLKLPGRLNSHGNWLTVGAICAVIALLLIVRGTQAQYFVRHSLPDQFPQADVTLHIDFEDKLRLLAVNLPPESVSQGSPITVVAYWRALQALEDDYAVFLHLDIPTTGETVATTDQLHPNDIPTSGWATGQYVRNQLTLEPPADAPPIQYSLRIGVYDHDGHLLDRADGNGDSVEVGRIWVTPQTTPSTPDGPHIRFGETIELLGADTSTEALTLYWRTQAPIEYPYSVFVHLLDSDSNLLGQLDGVPYANRYPLPAWQPGQIIVDRRPLAEATPDVEAIARFAIGIYDPRSGARLPALNRVDMEDANLFNDTVLVEFR